MNNQERDKFLTEALGECWHLDTDGNHEVSGFLCCKCKPKYNEKTHTLFTTLSSNFSTWEGFGKLWEWSVKQEWWKYFMFSPKVNQEYEDQIELKLINPDRFANAIYNFLKERSQG